MQTVCCIFTTPAKAQKAGLASWRRMNWRLVGIFLVFAGRWGVRRASSQRNRRYDGAFDNKNNSNLVGAISGSFLPP